MRLPDSQHPEPAPGRGRSLRARERNRLAILTAAQNVLSSNPDASMDDIAEAANMVRRTVYGHFSTRQDLIASVVRLGAQELIAYVGEVDVHADDAPAEMAGLILRTWGTASRFGPVIEVARRGAADALFAAMEPFNTTVAALIRHGQEQGAFQSPLDADLLAHLIEACSLTFHAAQQKGVWDGDETDVAYSQLLTLGVPAAKARATVDRAAAAHPTEALM
ncbi:TetR/AcrR family transcriptional regulator [Streptomyces sp. NPDC058375]|uniref:TetR/AcrR family transcriptional regulator n=1 Tax=Streptomyces sp. NPDC058375 TaxID=3346467 RepID=UPI003646994B